MARAAALAPANIYPGPPSGFDGDSEVAVPAHAERLEDYPPTHARAVELWAQAQADGAAPGLAGHFDNGTPSAALVNATAALCSIAVEGTSVEQVPSP